MPSAPSRDRHNDFVAHRTRSVRRFNQVGDLVLSVAPLVASAARDALRSLFSFSKKPMALSQYVNIKHDWTNKHESKHHKAARERAKKNLVKEMNQNVSVAKWERYLNSTLSSVNDLQGMFCLPSLCGLYGGTQYNDDLQQIALNMPLMTATGQNWPAGTALTNELLILGASQSVEFTNQSATLPCYIDIYRCVSTKPAHFANPITTTNPSHWAGGSAVSVSTNTSVTIGVTPFDLKEFVACNKILSKESMYLAANQNIEFTWRMKRPFTFDATLLQSVSANNEYSLPGHTEFLFIVLVGPVGPATKASASTVSCLTTNRYRVKPFVSASGGLIETVQTF